MDIKFYWELPTVQSDFTNHDYIRYNAKLHCYVDNQSLCKKYIQDADFFEKYDIAEFLKEHGEDYVCKRCLIKYREMTQVKKR